MPAVRLSAERVAKPWGRTVLWPGFADAPAGSDPIGEIGFPPAVEREAGLRVRFLFAGGKSAIKVHPAGARDADKAWLVLAADPHAAVAIGVLEVMTRDRLRAAALDGTIEELVDWRAVKPGDAFYVPAGTVHALGPGLTLVEIGPSAARAFRLDGDARSPGSQLDAAVAAAEPVPYVAPHLAQEVAPGRTVLAAGPALTVERWTRAGTVTTGSDGPVWLIPLAGSVSVDGETIAQGGVWLVDGGTTALVLETGADLLVAYPGATVADEAWQAAPGA